MRKILFFMSVVFFAVQCGPKETAMQEEVQAGISIEDAWVREVPEVNTSSAAYMKIVNNSDEETVLVSAQNDISEVTEIHEMVMDGETMKMRKIDSIVIPARGSVDLQPGGLHIMLINLTKKTVEGEVVKLTLEFKSGESLEVEAPIKKATETSHHEHNH